jgi:hypothetical protein
MHFFYLTLLFLLWILGQASAQKDITVKLEMSLKKTDSAFFANDSSSVFRWGKVPEEDLKMANYPLHTSVDNQDVFQRNRIKTSRANRPAKEKITNDAGLCSLKRIKNVFVNSKGTPQYFATFERFFKGLERYD